MGTIKRYTITATLIGATLIPFYFLGFTAAFSGIETFGIILMFLGFILTILYSLTVLTLAYFTRVPKVHKQALKQSLLFLLLGIVLGAIMVYLYYLIVN